LSNILEGVQSGGGQIHRETWPRQLHVAEGNIARLESATENPDLVRIAIARVETRFGHDIQLNLLHLRVASSHHYSLSFLARADKARSIAVGCAQGSTPWANLGLRGRVELGPEWLSYELAFTCTANCDDARIHFDAGESHVSVDITAVVLRSLSEGRFVRSGSPAAETEVVGSRNIRVGPSIGIGDVNFGSFRRLTPISDCFGYDRGRPIDRYYIEKYLAARAADVRGHVLEIGDDTYTRRFGEDHVTRSDVLHLVEGQPEATIVADLSAAGHIPSDSFDCIILTQTLQLIYDFRAALRTIHRILKPGGVLLATFPGISQTYDSEWRENWCWNFTDVSARRVFEEVFPPSSVEIDTFGNVLSAMSFLHGLAVEELSRDELDYRDTGYDVTIAVRAKK
jgi:SAM-dependent methyltransferase